MTINIPFISKDNKTLTINHRDLISNSHESNNRASNIRVNFRSIIGRGHVPIVVQSNIPKESSMRVFELCKKERKRNSNKETWDPNGSSHRTSRPLTP